MSAFSRVVCLLLAVFAVIYLAGAAVYLGQARADIQREITSASTLARNLGSPQALSPGAVAQLRHIRPASLEPSGPGHVPEPVFRYLTRSEAPLPEINGWQADPSDEVAEIWESLVLISAAYGVGMILCLLAAFWAVRQGARPLQALERAMQGVEDGRLSSRLPPQPVPELDRLGARFNAMAGALEREQATVSKLMSELLKVRDRERAHIARSLHDDLGQYLTGIRAQAQAWVLDRSLSDTQRSQARQLAGHCETVQGHFRALLQDLHPLVLEQLGLASAIQHLVDEWQQLSGLPCDLELDAELPVLAEESSADLYRFLQEALNNVARHAQASRVRLGVRRSVMGTDAGGDHSQVAVEVVDNGCGADDLDRCVGLGIRSMRERARSLGGSLEFVTGLGRGMQVRLLIPVGGAASPADAA